MKKNKLIIISGASGSGKSTIIKSIMSNELISFTTRIPRDGEVNGKDYIFITEDKFNELLHSNGLMEWTQYGENHYGLTREEFETKLSHGDAYFIADVNGLKQMKELYDNIVSVFIYCDKMICERHMKIRGDTEKDIEKRLNTYDEEIMNMRLYDYIVINTDNNLRGSIREVGDIIGGSSWKE